MAQFKDFSEHWDHKNWVSGPPFMSGRHHQFQPDDFDTSHGIGEQVIRPRRPSQMPLDGSSLWNPAKPNVYPVPTTERQQQLRKELRRELQAMLPTSCKNPTSLGVEYHSLPVTQRPSIPKPAASTDVRLYKTLDGSLFQLPRNMAHLVTEMNGQYALVETETRRLLKMRSALEHEEKLALRFQVESRLTTSIVPVPGRMAHADMNRPNICSPTFTDTITERHYEGAPSGDHYLWRPHPLGRANTNSGNHLSIVEEEEKDDDVKIERKDEGPMERDEESDTGSFEAVCESETIDEFMMV